MECVAELIKVLPEIVGTICVTAVIITWIKNSWR